MANKNFLYFVVTLSDLNLIFITSPFYIYQPHCHPQKSRSALPLAQKFFR
jgi:hypothetical protein